MKPPANDKYSRAFQKSQDFVKKNLSVFKKEDGGFMLFAVHKTAIHAAASCNMQTMASVVMSIYKFNPKIRDFVEENIQRQKEELREKARAKERTKTADQGGQSLQECSQKDGQRPEESNPTS